jgi:hypothetical protein
MRPTNRHLRQLLLDIGFEARESVEPNCVVFEHPKSNARLLLPANRDQAPAREADILSIRTHLLYRGLIDQATFDAFLQDRTHVAP